MTPLPETRDQDRVRVGEGTTLVGMVGMLDQVAGAERAYWLASSGLRDLFGFELLQVTQRPPVGPLPDEREVHALRPGGRRGFLGLPQLFAFRRILRDAQRPAILFSFQLNTNILSVFANALLPSRLRLPVVVNDRANIISGTTPVLDRGVAWFGRVILVRFLSRWAYRRASVVVCNSRQNADQVREFLGKGHPPVTAIPNPVEVGAIQDRFPERDRSSFLRPGVPVIAGHGRLFHDKGWEMLIRVLARVRNEFPAARLRVVGEGLLLPQLERLAEEFGVRGHCDFEGFTDDPLPKVEDTDVYVLASRSEGMPNSLLEAVALGLPCVSTDCATGPAEILGRDERTGRLVPVDGEDEMTAAILELLRDGATRHALARAARERAWDFRTEACVEAYAELLADYCARDDTAS